MSLGVGRLTVKQPVDDPPALIDELPHTSFVI